MASESWDMVRYRNGTVAVVARSNALCRVFFSRSGKEAQQSVLLHYPHVQRLSQGLIQDGFQQLSEYFLGNRRSFELELDNGSLSPFTVAIQQALLNVPFGSVVTYGELAAIAGFPGAARAVGSAMSSNRFPIIVPCHRVVKADGSLGQYSGANGTETKLQLIEFEKSML
jgi:methylated-DNA-[protein]-cysteine S-methyltransferase